MNEFNTIAIPIGRADSLRCATQHFGVWSIEAKWFRAAVDAIRTGTLKPATPKADCDDDDCGNSDPMYTVQDGVAVICIDGQMTKRGSSFGGCSTIEVREAVRSAAKDFSVRAIMLHICSPGGTVSGTGDLAEDVANAGEIKPVDCYIADCGCSAAYWIASQCRTIYANTTAIVGSIGTYALLEDDTGMQDQVGLKYRVVSTGEYKGLGADGEVSDKLVADVQREVNELNAVFLAAVAVGRGDKIADLAAVSDGRAYAAAQSKTLGLIDEVTSFDVAMSAITQEVSIMDAKDFAKYAAEHPDDATLVENREKAVRAADAAKDKSSSDRMKAVAEAAGNNDALFKESMLAGLDATAVKVASKVAADAKAKADASTKSQADALAAKDAEIALLKEQAAFKQGEQPPVAARGKDPKPIVADPDDIDAVAKADWAAMNAEQKSEWLDEKTYAGFRKADAKGQVRASKVQAA